MITTETGAKKIENSDNWRQIFDAHNDSVDAEDKLAPDMAPIVNGNKCAAGAAVGEYVLVRNSSITGITDGAYRAAQAIPANTVIDSTYLTAITGGIANDLNSKIVTRNVDTIIAWGTYGSGTHNLATAVKNGDILVARFGYDGRHQYMFRAILSEYYEFPTRYGFTNIQFNSTGTKVTISLISGGVSSDTGYANLKALTRVTYLDQSIT